VRVLLSYYGKEKFIYNTLKNFSNLPHESSRQEEAQDLAEYPASPAQN